MVTKNTVSLSRNWQDLVSLVLGVWLFLSLWELNYVDVSPVASQAAWVIGALLFVIGLLSRFTFHLAEEIIEFILGLCLIASPWVLGYASNATPAANAVIVGVLVLVLSVWEIWDNRRYIEHPA